MRKISMVVAEVDNSFPFEVAQIMFAIDLRMQSFALLGHS